MSAFEDEVQKFILKALQEYEDSYDTVWSHVIAEKFRMTPTQVRQIVVLADMSRCIGTGSITEVLKVMKTRNTDEASESN